MQLSKTAVMKANRAARRIANDCSSEAMEDLETYLIDSSYDEGSSMAYETNSQFERWMAWRELVEETAETLILATPPSSQS